MPADDLLGGITEDALGSLVPTGDHPVQILGCDDVVGRLHDRCQPLVQLLGPPPLRHVAESEDHAAELPVFGDDRGGGTSSMGISLASAVMSTRVIGQTDDVARGEHPLNRVFDGATGDLVDDVEDLVEWPAGSLSLPPAGERSGGGVGKNNSAKGCIRCDDSITDAHERHCQAIPSGRGFTVDPLSVVDFPAGADQIFRLSSRNRLTAASFGSRRSITTSSATLRKRGIRTLPSERQGISPPSSRFSVSEPRIESAVRVHRRR